MQEILKFWFEKYGHKDWFRQDRRFDMLISKKFSKLWESRSKSKLDLKQSPKYLLAEIILFDQLSRNIFRGTPKAYSEDKRALAISRYILNKKLYTNFSKDEKVFLYMPFMHSENIEEQKMSVKLFKKLNYFDYLKYAEVHYEEIKKFGNFPKREIVKNAIRKIEIIGFGFSGLSVFVKYVDYCIINGIRNIKITLKTLRKYVLLELGKSNNLELILKSIDHNLVIYLLARIFSLILQSSLTIKLASFSLVLNNQSTFVLFLFL